MLAKTITAALLAATLSTPVMAKQDVPDVVSTAMVCTPVYLFMSNQDGDAGKAGEKLLRGAVASITVWVRIAYPDLNKDEQDDFVMSALTTAITITKDNLSKEERQRQFDHCMSPEVFGEFIKTGTAF
jgi:hypothetical protein